MQRQPVIGAIVFGALFTLVGLYFSYAMWHTYGLQQASSSYRPVPARVVSAEVRSETGGGRDRTRSYRLVVTYRYQVDGGEFESQRFGYQYGVYSERDEADQVAERYPPGKDITAYYDPAEPAKAVLDRSEPTLLWPIAFSLLFPGVGLGVLGYGIRGKSVNPS